MAVDSPLASRFWGAESWSRSGKPILAIVIHMAQGGNTASWLTRIDGNSSHYVVEYDGDIIQQVREARAAGSIKASLLRTSNDAPFTYLGETITYGIKARRAALGVYDKDPNAVVIAIEVEGFAAAGPNAFQRTALKRLVADIQRRHGGGLHILGHRDFQSYKACPGKLIPWADYGGHGLPTTEEPDMPGLALRSPQPFAGRATIKDDGERHAAVIVATQEPFWLAAGASKDVVLKVQLEKPWPDHPSGVAYVVGDGLAVLLEEDIDLDGEALVPESQVDDLIAADRARARIIWS